MRVYNVNLKEEYPFLKGGNLECILMDKPSDDPNYHWKRPALIVVPGGGYAMVSKREGEPIAHFFLAKGFQVFILTYLVAKDGVRYPEQLFELSAAVDFVKKHAEEFCVNPDEVFAVGFSAGGHLVGNLCVEHQAVPQKSCAALDCKLTAAGLCYPVISKINGHQGSYENLLNGYTDEEKSELLKTLNLDEAVSEQTPPAFIWTTATDGAVPADNAIRYALALARKGISYELHVYPEGSHGLSSCSEEVNASPQWDFKRMSRWTDDCAIFFRRYTKERF